MKFEQNIISIFIYKFNFYIRGVMANQKVLKNLKLIFVGILSGVVNGFFGAGAGLLLVPLMTYVGGLDSRKSHATTLACVTIMCACCSVVYFASNVIDYKLLLLCLIGSIIGALIGSKLLKDLKNSAIDLIFALALIGAGVCLFLFR